MNGLIPSTSIAFWQYVDFFVVTAVSCVVLGLLLAHKGKLLATVSQTIAATPRSSLLFSLLMTVCAPLYYGFVWFWVGPLSGVSRYFYLVVALSFIAEMIFVWVPATVGRSKKIHDITSGFVGIVMFLAPLMLLLSGNLDALAQLAVITFLAASTVLLALLFIPRLRAYTLHIEVVYCVMFWAVMSFVAHG